MCVPPPSRSLCPTERSRGRRNRNPTNPLRNDSAIPSEEAFRCFLPYWRNPSQKGEKRRKKPLWQLARHGELFPHGAHAGMAGEPGQDLGLPGFSQAPDLVGFARSLLLSNFLRRTCPRSSSYPFRYLHFPTPSGSRRDPPCTSTGYCAQPDPNPTDPRRTPAWRDSS